MRIFVVSGYNYWGDISPNDVLHGTRQVGGGETAMMSIASGLASLGHEVVVFYDCKPGNYGGADYLPSSLYVPMVTQMQADVLIAWDAIFAFRYADRSKVHVSAFQLNDAFIGVYDWIVDMYAHPSQWHADMFHKLYPEMSPQKSVVRITNGIDYERYSVMVERIPGRVIYSASPDRGLHHVLRFWNRIRHSVADAELHVYYDISKWLAVDESAMSRGIETMTHERAVEVRSWLEKPPDGVVFHGGVGQGELAKAQMSSQVMIYPCDPVRPTEGFSMTVLEGTAAGCNVVISNADAFSELWSNTPGVTMLPLPIDDNVWAETVIEKLKEDSPNGVRVNPALSWKTLSRRWEQELNRCLMSKCG